MPTLSLNKWARYEPSIPGNLDLPAAERFYLLVNASMPAIDFESIVSDIRSAKNDSDLAAALSRAVRMGDVPLTIDGRPVLNSQSYLELVLSHRGAPLWSELQERVMTLNSFEGVRELFFVRPSGGTVSTPEQKAAQSEK